MGRKFVREGSHFVERERERELVGVLSDGRERADGRIADNER